VRRCANIPGRNKPDFCGEQKIIFQAIGQSIFLGKSQLLSRDKGFERAMGAKPVLRSRRLSPRAIAAGIGHPEIAVTA
jgi:hypothetical protein